MALLKTEALDAIAAGEDAMKPRKKRFFSRAEQRRRLAEAECGLLRLLDAAERGLPSESVEVSEDG